MAHNRFEEAIKAIDAYHERDPGKEMAEGKAIPAELLYAQRITTRLADFEPDASEAVRLAARCQHIGRWEIPREKYPMDRKGYLQWRNEEKMHHARIAEKILAQVGYDQEVIDKVKFLVMKKELHSNPDTQLLEDVVCLVFVEYYLDEFAAKHDDDKVVDILQKTLKKMSVAGKAALSRLNFSPKIASLIRRATDPF